MEANFKKLIGEINNNSTKELLEDHIKDIIIEAENKTITIIIDRKYALNQLSSNDNIGNLLKGVKKAFGDDFETILKIVNHKFGRYGNEHHDREMNIPLFIHYS